MYTSLVLCGPPNATGSKLDLAQILHPSASIAVAPRQKDGVQERDEALLWVGASIHGASVVNQFIDAGVHGGSSARWRMH